MTEPEENPRKWRTEKVRRPWVQMDYVARQLRSELEALNPGIELHAGGSYRRHKSTVGDLDFVIVTPNGDFEPDLMHDFKPIEFPGEAIHSDRGGKKIMMGDYSLDVPKVNEDGTLSSFFVEELTVHVDFWSCSPSERGAFLWFITGPMELNVAMRTAAIKRGLSLSQNGVYVRDFKEVPITRGPNKGQTRRELNLLEQVDDGTEEGVARVLGWRMLTPEEREKWAQPAGSATEEFRVEGSKPGTFYQVTVNVGKGQASCTCRGFQFRKECKHSKAALAGELPQQKGSTS